MKTIVTHLSPDLDAITSSWLVSELIPDFKDAEFAFVPAGTTLNGMEPDSDPDIIHVDTGLGKFDHHQYKEKWSASKMVFDYAMNKDLVKEKDKEALARLVDFVNLIDNFGEAYFPDPTNDVYEFTIHQFLSGLRPMLNNDTELLKTGFLLLRGILNVLRMKIYAENDIKEGVVFKTKYGKSLGLESKNEEATKLALKQGFKVVVRKDKERGFLSIKTFPEKGLDLTPVYEIVKKKDPKATWFLHGSTHMLLNGSAKNPNSVPTVLPVSDIIEILSKI